MSVKSFSLEGLWHRGLLFGVLFLLPATAFVARGRIAPPFVKSNSELRVSELHVPGYVESKIPFILREEDLVEEESGHGTDAVLTKRAICQQTYTSRDYESLIPHQDGHLLHKTRDAVFLREECQSIVMEAERVAATMDWTRNRHGNYPTCDLPLVELPETLAFLKVALVERIYPLLTQQFGTFLPDPTKLVRKT